MINEINKKREIEMNGFFYEFIFGFFLLNFFVMILRPDCVPLSRKSEENSLTKTSVMTRKRRSNATIVLPNAKVVLPNIKVFLYAQFC